MRRGRSSSCRSDEYHDYGLAAGPSRNVGVSTQSGQRCPLSDMSTSLIGRLGSSASGYPPLRCRCRSRARASLRNRHQGPSIMGFEDKVEQSFGRPCPQCDGRSKQTYDLTSSIVPRGTSFHRLVELEFPPIGFGPARSSCCCRDLFPGPAELGAINPYAVHDHGQPARQRHDRLFHPAAPGDLHRPGLEP
jgi:hypothetical protein